MSHKGFYVKFSWLSRFQESRLVESLQLKFQKREIINLYLWNKGS